MPYTIAKDFHFEAAHRLDGLPPDHKCSRLHGHNYRVRVYLRAASLDRIGFVEDFGVMACFDDWLKQHWDHRHLNECVAFNPTAENLAVYLFAIAKGYWPEFTHAVRVYETPDCYAEYKEDG